MGQVIVKRPACELSPGWESGMWTLGQFWPSRTQPINGFIGLSPSYDFGNHPRLAGIVSKTSQADEVVMVLRPSSALI